jgi:glycosyltransferase involved in cell wall biosynthesis
MLEPVEKVKFTVVIPTRERCDTLISCINSVLSQDYSNYSILVSDNDSRDSTREVVNSILSPKIKYVNTGKRVSMSHNWEYALSHIDSGWITILGDDDALVPGALKRVSQLIELTGTKAIRSNGAFYSWPSILGNKYGRLSFSLRRNFQTVDSRKALLDVLRGNKKYNTLPMLYNGGFIDAELIKKAKSISGNFFHSMTPDVYSAMVFALLTDSYIYSYEALAINGASHHSNGTAVFSRKAINRSYNPSAKFYSEDNIPLHDDIPYADSGNPVTSLHACILEAYLQAEKFFRDKYLPVPTYADHLKIILHESSSKKEEVIDWGKLFAEKNNLDFSTIEASKSPVLKVNKKKIERLLYLASSLSFQGVSSNPLLNVYEASVIVGSFKRFGASPFIYCKCFLENFLRKITEKLTKKNETNY